MKRIGFAAWSIGSLLLLVACSASSSSIGAGGRSASGGSAGAGNQTGSGGVVSGGGSGNSSSGGAATGGAGNASSGGTAGVVSGGGDQGSGGAVMGSTELELRYQNRSQLPSSFILFTIQVENKIIYSVPLKEIEIRYYVTLNNEATKDQQLQINNVRIPNPIGGSEQDLRSDLVLATVAMPTPTATADHYFSMSFVSTSTRLLRMTDVLELIIDDYSQDKLNQSNDYSFNNSATSPTVSDHITVYRNGNLVWGVPPS